jgi:hypothetical protein
MIAEYGWRLALRPGVRSGWQCLSHLALPCPALACPEELL